MTLELRTVGTLSKSLAVKRERDSIGSARVTLVEGVWADQEGER